MQMLPTEVSETPDSNETLLTPRRCSGFKVLMQFLKLLNKVATSIPVKQVSPKYL